MRFPIVFSCAVDQRASLSGPQNRSAVGWPTFAGWEGPRRANRPGGCGRGVRGDRCKAPCRATNSCAHARVHQLRPAARVPDSGRGRQRRIQVRSRRCRITRDGCYQADLGDPEWWAACTMNRDGTGAGEGGRWQGAAVLKAADWNDYEIAARGAIRLAINGHHGGLRRADEAIEQRLDRPADPRRPTSERGTATSESRAAVIATLVGGGGGGSAAW